MEALFCLIMGCAIISLSVPNLLISIVGLLTQKNLYAYKCTKLIVLLCSMVIFIVLVLWMWFRI
jgi:hypothetical protein